MQKKKKPRPNSHTGGGGEGFEHRVEDKRGGSDNTGWKTRGERVTTQGGRQEGRE